MNKQLRHVCVASLVLLATLLVSTTYWQTWAVGDLANRQDNAVALVARLTVDRGKILVPGTVFARNRRHRHKGLTTFSRVYPQAGLAAQAVGYATTAGTTTGLEQSLDDYLTGANTNLSNTLTQELDKLGGQTVHGDNAILTLRPAVQALALQQLAGRCGAVVAMDVKTGAVLAMASSPTYNPNLIGQRGGWAKIGKIKGACGDASALVNNTTAGLYTPGSTFKLVTASAALDTGAVTPTTGFYDPGYCIEYGKKVYNSSAPDSPTAHETFGHVTFSQGLEHSINSVFCNTGKQIGAKTILEYAKRYGFYSLPPVDLPPNETQASGLYNFTPRKGFRLYWPTDFNRVDPGRLAFGQERMLATPLQMGLVAATIANGGVEPKPYLVRKIEAPDGSTVAKTAPQTLGRVIKPRTAAELNQMMQLVVEGGTGTAAQIPGVRVAGKTGTAEIGNSSYYNAWFVCFAPADHPRYMVAVVVAKQLNGFGGSISAPIAKAVLEKLLGR